MPFIEEVDANVPATRLPTGVQQMAADLLPAAGDHVVFTRPLIEGGVPCVPCVQGFHVLPQTPTTEIVAKGSVGVVEKIILKDDPANDIAAVRVEADVYRCAPLHLLTVTKRADKASTDDIDSDAADDAAQEDATEAATPAELAERPAETAHNADGGSAKLLGAFGHADVQVLNRWADVFRFGLDGDDRSPSPPLSDGDDNHWEAPKEALTEALPAPATLASEVPAPTTLNVGIA
jgi:hypothetical protein